MSNQLFHMIMQHPNVLIFGCLIDIVKKVACESTGRHTCRQHVASGYCKRWQMALYWLPTLFQQ